MRILIFYQYFGTPNGSWSTRMYELAKRWVDRGHKVTVVTSPYEKSDIRTEKIIDKQNVEGIDLIVINFPDSNRYNKIKRIYYFMMFSLLSIWYALTEQYDIAIASSGPITIGIPVLFAKFIRKKKYIFEVRDLWPEGAIALGILNMKILIKLSFWFEKILYKNASLIVGCSKGMTDNIHQRYPNVETKIISNACDLELFQSFANNVEVQNNKFIYTGSIGAMDDVDHIVNAVKILKEKGITNFKVDIIGDGADKCRLEKRVKEYCLDNISFIGLLPKKEVAVHLKNSTAAFICFKPLKVFNTVSPNKMFDAFAAGIPIIQNTDGWIKDYVNKKRCGLNVIPNNMNDMADAIEIILADPVLRKELADNALEVAKSEFNRDILALEYLRFIENASIGKR